MLDQDELLTTHRGGQTDGRTSDERSSVYKLHHYRRHHDIISERVVVVAAAAKLVDHNGQTKNHVDRQRTKHTVSSVTPLQLDIPLNHRLAS